jgi:hypothetical protein
MDNRTKAAIRKSAKRRFWGTVIALLLALVLTAGAQLAQGLIAGNYSRAMLARESSALTREFLRFEAGRGQELALFPPPPDPSRLEIWAKRIQDQLDQSAAVCIIDPPALLWIRMPHGFDVSADSVGLLLTSPDMFPQSPTLKHFGDIQVMRTSFQSGRDIHTLFLFNRGRDSLNWGVLVSSNDTWRSFFGTLEQSAADDPDVGSPAWALQDMFALPKSPTPRWNIGIRAFVNDSVIYTSRDLDTTRQSYTYDFNGRRAECYLSRWQEAATHWKIMRYAFWPMFLFPVALIVLFYRDYRQIRELTDDDD